MKNLRFYISNEVDVFLNGLEMLRTVILGIAICAAPFIVKMIGLWLGV